MYKARSRSSSTYGGEWGGGQALLPRCQEDHAGTSHLAASNEEQGVGGREGGEVGGGVDE